MICIKKHRKKRKLSLHNGDKVGQARRVSGLSNTEREIKIKAKNKQKEEVEMNVYPVLMDIIEVLPPSAEFLNNDSSGVL